MPTNALVHRCTFVPWNPHTINSIAYDDNSKTQIAVARSDGDIEVWNCFEKKWFLESVITGCKERPLKVVVWSKGRLFGASLAGEIYEFDIHKLSIRTSCKSNGGAIWDLKVSPADPFSLAAACEDGRLRILQIQKDDIQFQRACSGTKNGERLLSVCWHTDGEVLFCGGADSMIRCVVAQSGRTLFSMTVENYGQEPTLIWSLKVLSDFTVISGDSLGHVQVWDGGVGTLLQTFAVHEADVLSVQVSADESRIFATGIDSKIMQFACIDSSNNVGSPRKWVSTQGRRYHTHDLLSMIVTKDRDGNEIIIAGGIDTQLSYLQVTDFEDPRGKVHKFLPFRQDAVCCATKSRLIMCAQHENIDIWVLGSPKLRTDRDLEAMKPHSKLELTRGHKHLFKIKVATDGQNLQCSAITNNGRWLACASSLTGLRLYRLRNVTDLANVSAADADLDTVLDDDRPSISRVKILPSIMEKMKKINVHKLLFSDDSSQLLIVLATGRLLILLIPHATKSVTTLSDDTVRRIS